MNMLRYTPPRQTRTRGFRRLRLFSLTMKSTIFNNYLGVKSKDETKQQIAEFKEHNPWLYRLARFGSFGLLGLGVGNLLGYSFTNFGFGSGIIAAAALGSIPVITSKFFGDKIKKGNLGTLISLDTSTGQFVFPATIGLVYSLSNTVETPIGGSLVGAAAVLPALTIPLLALYLPWGIINYGKYKETGLGRFSDLKVITKSYCESFSNLFQMGNSDEDLESRSFIYEFSDMYGKCLAFSTPFYLLRIIAGVVASFTPETFFENFTAILFTFSPYFTPFYLLYYGAVEPRVNSSTNL